MPEQPAAAAALVGALVPSPPRPVLEVVVPVHNEERVLHASVERLRSHLCQSFPYAFRITIADNASTDGTWDIARRLAARFPDVQAARLEPKGRGGALRAAWAASDADVVAYMDVDLSTGLAAVAPLVAPLLSGHSDLAVGTRLAPSSRVSRGPVRELVSRCYNALLHLTLRTRFTDAQCGFKAVRADRAKLLLPFVRDDGWFFDTELLYLAERSGMRIHEVPVDWVEDPDSRVDLVRTALDDLRGVGRLLAQRITGRSPVPQLRRAVRPVPPGAATQVLRFVVVGALSTLAYLALYVALRSVTSPQLANGSSLLVTAVGNTALNRRWTFGVRGRARVFRQHGQGVAVFALALALTAGSLAALRAVAAAPPRSVEVAVLVVANLAATAVRFAALRRVVFRPAHGGGASAVSVRSA